MNALGLLSVLGLMAGTALGASSSMGSGLVVLHPSANGALTMTGNSSVHIPAKAVYVNSTSNSAVKTTGNAVLDAPYLYVCGETSFTGNSGCTGQICHSGVPYGDPLGSTALPNAQGQSSQGSLSISGGTRNLSPGYWAGGGSITGNATVNLAPGVYMFGGNLNVSSGCVISGSGVTIVMVGGSLSCSGQSTMNLSPPSSGNLANIVIAQPGSNSKDMSLSGGSGMNISGAIYCPGATLTLTGQGTVQGDGPQMGDLVICRQATLTGQGSIKIGHAEMQAIELPKQPLAD